MNNNNNIFSPSFKFERKTKALNISLWGFVGLILLFVISIFIIPIFLFLNSFFDIISSFFIDNFVLISAICISAVTLMMGVGIFKFLNTLLYSYKFEDNKIIKGRIVNIGKVKNNDLVFDTIMTTYMAKNITNSKAVRSTKTMIDMHNIINLIKLNTNQEFVNKFFDNNDIYKKKVYNNPQFVKEKKYSLVYICENNKKLVIPKLYEGMNITTNNSKESSILSRVLIRSLIITYIFFLFYAIDLFVGISNNDEYKSNINNNCEIIQTNLDSYGYSLNKNGKFKEFTKIVSNNEKSTIKYYFDKNGNITEVNLDLYYDDLSYNDNELKYIISTLNNDFSNDEIDDFINRVNSCVDGNCSYGKFKNLRLGSSNGFIHIHN